MGVEDQQRCGPDAGLGERDANGEDARGDASEPREAGPAGAVEPLPIRDRSPKLGQAVESIVRSGLVSRSYRLARV